VFARGGANHKDHLSCHSVGNEFARNWKNNLPGKDGGKEGGLLNMADGTREEWKVEERARRLIRAPDEMTEARIPPWLSWIPKKKDVDGRGVRTVKAAKLYGTYAGAPLGAPDGKRWADLRH